MIESLNTLHASAPADQRPVYCLRLSNFAFGHLRLAQSYFDITVTEETGNIAEYQKSSLKISLPSKNANGKQDLTFELPNIHNESYAFVDKVRKAQRDTRILPTEATLLVYNSADYSAPLDVLPLNVKNTSSTQESVTVRAGYFDMINTAYPKRRYTLEEFPGLEYV